MMLSLRGSQTSICMRIMHSGVEIAQPLTLSLGTPILQVPCKAEECTFFGLALIKIS